MQDPTLPGQGGPHVEDRKALGWLGAAVEGLPALIEGLARDGVPDEILTDNGKVFTGRVGKRIVVRGSAWDAASWTSRSGTPASSAAVMNAWRSVSRHHRQAIHGRRSA